MEQAKRLTTESDAPVPKIPAMKVLVWVPQSARHLTGLIQVAGLDQQTVGQIVARRDSIDPTSIAIC